MNILRHVTTRRTSLILTLGLAFLIQGCITEERDLNGSVAITLDADFTTQGTTESLASSGSLSEAEIDEVLEALDDADIDAIRNAVADERDVLIGGMRAFVTENRGNDATRSAEIRVDTGAGLRTMATMNVPTNATGTEASVANGRIVIEPAFTGLVELRDELNAFLDAYLAGNRAGARAILRSVSWEATWTSTDPAPSPAQPDDFDWTAEIVVLVPAQYEIEVPSF